MVRIISTNNLVKFVALQYIMHDLIIIFKKKEIRNVGRTLFSIRDNIIRKVVLNSSNKKNVRNLRN